MKIVAVEVELEARGAAAKSFPERRLLPDFDDEAADNKLLAQSHEGQVDCPPRGRDRPAGTNKELPAKTHPHGKIVVKYLEPFDLRDKIHANKAPARSIYR